MEKREEGGVTERRGDDRGIGREGIMNDEWHGSSGEEME